MFTLKKIGIWLGIVVVAMTLVFVAMWFLKGGASTAGTTFQAFFGTAEPFGNTGGTGTPGEGGNTPIDVGGSEYSSGASQSGQKIFLITAGTVVAATLIESGVPTTTRARYITGTDGHILELPLDTPGAMPRVLSQTTIPGVVRALWTDGGNGALMQYQEGGTVKTVHLKLLAASSSDTAPMQSSIRFLPDNITDLAVAPDSVRVAYLIPMSTGLDGYIARSDGSAAKKVFTLPLSEMVLGWPSDGTLLAYSKAEPGISGIVFSINAATGAVSPILYGQGITAAANGPFTHVLYQIADGSSMQTFVADPKTGISTPIQGTSRSLLPEQCAATTTRISSVLYCAAPTSAPPGNFLSAWHKGVASIPNGIVVLDLATGIGSILANPGTSQGGENSNIIELALSPSKNYLSFINKNNGKLFGVRLTP
jgi:hypothetical protein